jgi:CDP-diacylglycerol--glycerol-3-phosphate 3-phosphatidyltransferase
VKDLPPDPISEPPSPSKIRNLPNALTVLRLLLVPLFGWLLLREGGEDTASRVWAFVIFVGATATDYLDGEIARRRSLVTTFGKIADPIADKALMGMALVGLSVLDELPWWVTIVILVREVGVTLLRFWVIRHGVIAAGRGGKLKTALQALAISLYLLPLSGPAATLRAWVMAAALVVTVVTGLHYVVKAVRLRRTPASHPAAA